MNDHVSTQQDSAVRPQIARALQFAGIFDIVLGVVIAVAGPRFVGSDPTTDFLLPIVGAVVALGGVAIWWYGRFVYARRASNQIRPPTVQHR